MLRPKQSSCASQKIPYEECLAKTVTTSEGKKPGASVLGHSITVGKVACELIRRTPDWLAKTVFPRGSDLVASVHDVGKISPGFQRKIREACGLSTDPNVPEDLDKLCGYHGAVSAVALADRHPGAGDIVGRHHGSSPAFVGSSDGACYGGPEWQTEREKLVSKLEAEFGQNWPRVVSDEIADVLSGLVTVADWIGSNDRFAEAGPASDEAVQQAVDEAGFTRPVLRSRLTFQEIFKFPPNEIQSEFAKLVRGPGVYTLEAPMGIGKTEAALYVAYRLLDESKATGIYFALPTQLTSNRLLDRMNVFLEAWNPSTLVTHAVK